MLGWYHWSQILCEWYRLQIFRKAWRLLVWDFPGFSWRFLVWDFPGFSWRLL